LSSPSASVAMGSPRRADSGGDPQTYRSSSSFSQVRWRQSASALGPPRAHRGPTAGPPRAHTLWGAGTADILTDQDARRSWILASFSLRSGAQVPTYVPLRCSRKPRQNPSLTGAPALKVSGMGGRATLSGGLRDERRHRGTEDRCKLRENSMSFNNTYKRVMAGGSPSHVWIELHRLVEAYCRTVAVPFSQVFHELERRFGFSRSDRSRWPDMDTMRVAARYLHEERQRRLELRAAWTAQRRGEKTRRVADSEARRWLGSEGARNQAYASSAPKVGYWGWRARRGGG
jgi:hypothetical protein